MAPSSSARWRWSVAEMVWTRNMAGSRIVLEQVEHLPAVQFRQAQVQGDGVGRNRRASATHVASR